jgi:hypothetical protein
MGEATEGEERGWGPTARVGGAGNGRVWRRARVARETGRERLGAAADRSRAGAVFSHWEK